MLPPTADIVIIGGGVMGTSAAYHLARRRAGRILLLEKAPFFGQGATGTCAGGIRHQFSTAVNVRLSTLSIRMLERFPEEMEQEIGLNQCGYLFLLSSPTTVALFREHVAMQHSLGIATEWLDVDEIARRAPLIDLSAEPAIVAGTFYGRDGLCDPHSVVQGYVKQARRLGADLRTNVAVTAIRVESGRVVGVETTAGFVATGTVLLTAGPWSAPLAATAGIDLPVVPLRRQIVVTRPLGIPRDMPFIIDFDQSLYFHYETGGILTGMSNPHETPGEKLEVDQAWTLFHLERAMARMPLLERAELLTQWAGLYEVTPDSQPIIGPLPVTGLFTCAGFSGHGFMQGPICGLLIAEDILDGGATTVDIAELRYERFLRGGSAGEKHVV
ncbi:MAG: FAD-binding oxidoreductase [Caldilineales bacterium]|nr:FAD-binding oxidoreductase [Caldilineales bacterium]